MSALEVPHLRNRSRTNTPTSLASLSRSDSVASNMRGGPTLQRKLPVCVVTHAYSSKEEHDLNLNKGDKVCVIRRSLSGWWEGKLADGSATGLFPCNHVRLLKGTYANAYVEQIVKNDVSASSSKRASLQAKLGGGNTQDNEEGDGGGAQSKKGSSLLSSARSSYAKSGSSARGDAGASASEADPEEVAALRRKVAALQEKVDDLQSGGGDRTSQHYRSSRPQTAALWVQNRVLRAQLVRQQVTLLRILNASSDGDEEGNGDSSSETAEGGAGGSSSKVDESLLHSDATEYWKQRFEESDKAHTRLRRKYKQIARVHQAQKQLHALQLERLGAASASTGTTGDDVDAASASMADWTANGLEGTSIAQQDLKLLDMVYTPLDDDEQAKAEKYSIAVLLREHKQRESESAKMLKKLQDTEDRCQNLGAQLSKMRKDLKDLTDDEERNAAIQRLEMELSNLGKEHQKLQEVFEYTNRKLQDATAAAVSSSSSSSDTSALGSGDKDDDDDEEAPPPVPPRKHANTIWR